MSDSPWEHAPRLREALRAQVEQCHSEDDAWERLHERCTNPDSRSGRNSAFQIGGVGRDAVFVDAEVEKHHIPSPISRALPRVVAVAACACLVVLALNFIDRSAPLDTAAPLDPDRCGFFSSQPTLLVASDETQVLVSSFAAEGFVDHQTLDPLIIDVAGVLSVAPQRSTLAQFEPVSVAHSHLVRDEIAAANCGAVAGAPNYLVAGGLVVADGLGCPTGGTGFRGMIVVEPVLPPVDCGPVPATLLSTELDPETQIAWERHYGCRPAGANREQCDVAIEILQVDPHELEEVALVELHDFWSR